MSRGKDFPENETPGLFREVTRCNRCGAFSHIAEQYCTCCGHRLKERQEEESVCARCGAEVITPLANYCHACGEKQTSPHSPPTEAPN
ncbi:MAG: hypothetical protein R3F28_00605 [Candidatus Kapaibacterium sp.]